LLSSFPSALPSFRSPSSTLAAVLRTAHLTGVVVVRGKMKREGLASPSLSVHAQPPSLPLVPWFACAGTLTPGSCSPSLPPAGSSLPLAPRFVPFAPPPLASSSVRVVRPPSSRWLPGSRSPSLLLLAPLLTCCCPTRRSPHLVLARAHW
jgi:hypothetical protein